ncbi:hypothetical protein BJY01DRAFT_46869 [Aspergillus pseudoustus]|uniref:Uncharacterized protein n=1 Tax=Aspergillus pseudoustus TaxID=1810923 RepID=A0ABR4JCG5_9EURO
MASTVHNHGDYNAVRPENPDHVTLDSGTVTLDPKTHPQQASNNPHDDGPALTPGAWGVGWNVPVMMVGFLISGALLALGHHLYYDTLDGTRVTSIEQQTWATRIGTGLAFLSRAFLVSAVGIAAVQETWATLRKKTVRLCGINSMFDVLNSPMAFFSWDLWRHAKTLTMLAIFSWLIPITAVITPATLSVDLLIISNTAQMEVPTVDFAANTTWNAWSTQYGPGLIEAPSPEISRLFAATSASINVLPASAPPLPNSSYILDFWGPSYRCERFSDAVTIDPSLQDIWNSEIRDQISQNMTVYIGSRPMTHNNTFFVYAAGSNPLWNPANTTQPTELVCQLWNTSYVVGLNFIDGIEALTPISTTPTAFANWNTDDGQRSLDPSFSELSGANAGFYVLHMLFGDLLHLQLRTGMLGSFSQMLPDESRPSISITQTGLFSCPDVWNSPVYQMAQMTTIGDITLCRNRTLARAIEDLSHNFTYSVLSLHSASTTVNVTSSFPQNFYSYNQRNLLAAYITSVGVTASCITVGLVAMHRNGVSQDTSFSTVLLTTRNPELDNLAIGQCLGSDKISDEVRNIQLRFGQIEGDREYRHAAFGTKASVTPIVKGRDYF